MASQTLLAFVVLASLLPTPHVHAHGYVQDMLINGQTYEGFLPFTDNYADPPVDTKITRHIPDDGPVLDYTSTNVTCNVGAEDAQWRTNRTAIVDAGSDMSFSWVRWPSDHLGPVTTYMANCGGSCTDFDATGNVWFKIDELGLVSGDTSTGSWASLLLIQNNLTWWVTIPPNLASGNYLIRHEILALHDAGAPQFYPSCSQLTVDSNGTSAPASSELVSIPGIYSNDTSTNIDIWTNPATSYPIAGPAVTTLQKYTSTNPKNLDGTSASVSDDAGATSSGSSNSTDQTNNSASSSSNDTTSSSGTSSSASKACRATKKRSLNSRKRHITATKRGINLSSTS